MGNFSLSHLPQSHCHLCGNGDFLELQPVHWRPGSGLTVKYFLPGFLPVSHDSSHPLGPSSFDWCCQSFFQGGLAALAERKLCACVSHTHTHALPSAIFLFRLRVWGGCGQKGRGVGRVHCLYSEIFLFLSSVALESFGSGGLTTRPWACLSIKSGDGG